MDEWSFLDEVDVLAKWPSDQKKLLFEGGKWSERKAALEAFNQLIEQNPRLATTSMTIYGELLDEIRKILDRESNIVVVTTTVRTVELLAMGLRNKFAGFIGMVLPFLIKRAKDKKKNVRDAVLAAVSALSDTTTPDRLQKDIIDWFGIPSPESKQTLLQFLYAYFIRWDAPDVPFVKAVAPLIVKAASESDVSVRDKACQALGSLRRLMGDSLAAFTTPISNDAAKMEKISQYQQEALEEWKKRVAERPNQAGGAQKGDAECSGPSETSESVTGPLKEVLDPWELLDAEDIGKKIEKTAETQLADKNWKERVAGGEAVKKEIDATGRIEISERTREISIQMIKIIEKDVNVNVAALSAQCLTGLALKSRFQFASLAVRAFPVVFDKLKDKKAVLRDALNEYCDAAASTTPLSTYSEAISTALASKNPQTRQQTALFLARFFSKTDQSTMEKDAVKQLAEIIQKTTNDADKDVREAAIRVVAGVQKCLGEGIAKRLMSDVYEDKLKSEKIPTIIEELEKEFGKSATAEMMRLAKHYKLGASAPASTSSGPSGPSGSSTSRKPASKPTGTARPMQSTSSRTSSATSAVRRVAPQAPPSAPRRAVSPAPRTAAIAPISSTSGPRPFVARPAPNFGANKPKIAVKPVVKQVSAQVPTTSRPASRPSSRPSSRGPAPRPSTSSSTSSSTISRVGPTARVTPIAPNVVRNGSIPIPGQRPVGVARPTQAGVVSGIVAPRSRIATPTTGIVRPTTTSSNIARPPSTNRIRQPSVPSRPGSRNENQ